MTGRRFLPAIICLPLLAGCSGMQSALDPRGPQAETIALLAWILFGGAALIFLGVMAMAAAGMIWPGRLNHVNPRRLMVGGGVVFTTAVLLVLTAYSTWVGGRLSWPADVRLGGLAAPEDPADAPLIVEVTGFMWWWEVRYPDTPHGPIVSANEVHVPVGRAVEFRLSTYDVIHSWWIPTLHGKRDLIPGRVNRITMTADEPGIVRGQCAEFCGDQHTLMAFFVVAHEPDEFDRWLARHAEPAAMPADPDLRAGAQAFLRNGCGSCHVIRGLAEDGLAARGQLGPDLTHVGGRLSIAAGTLPMGVGPLAGWIANAQGIKPNNRMPSFDRLDPDELIAIARYLESLK